jgi:ABC-type branched-subunit amino acid transport system permease subunit
MGGFQQYIIGARLPVAAAVALAALICGGLGCLIGVTGLKRLRADYQAMVMLVISILATTIIGADTGLFNGNAGLSLIPDPLASVDPARRGGTTSRWWAWSARRATWCCAGSPPARSAGRYARCARTRTLRSPSARTWWACGWWCRRWAGPTPG